MFKYCPKCKTKLNQTNNRVINCLNCGFRFYFSPAATNAVVIQNDKGAILLVKRKNEPKKGYWDFPGGFLEYDESAEDSVKREINEELDIELINFKYFRSYSDRYLFKGINYHTINFVYIAKIKNQKLIASDDITSYQFFTYKTIPYNNMAFPYMKNVLNDLLPLNQSPSTKKGE